MHLLLQTRINNGKPAWKKKHPGLLGTLKFQHKQQIEISSGLSLCRGMGCFRAKCQTRQQGLVGREVNALLLYEPGQAGGMADKESGSASRTLNLSCKCFGGELWPSECLHAFFFSPQAYDNATVCNSSHPSFHTFLKIYSCWTQQHAGI